MPYSVFRDGSEDPNPCFQLKNLVFISEYEGALVSFSTRDTRSYILNTSPMYWRVLGCSASSLCFPGPRIRWVYSARRSVQFPGRGLMASRGPYSLWHVFAEETHMAKVPNPCIHQSAQHSFQHIRYPRVHSFLHSFQIKLLHDFQLWDPRIQQLSFHEQFSENYFQYAGPGLTMFSAYCIACHDYMTHQHIIQRMIRQ